MLFLGASIPLLYTDVGVGNEAWNGLETAADVVVDELVPGLKWVESAKEDDDLLSDGAVV